MDNNYNTNDTGQDMYGNTYNAGQDMYGNTYGASQNTYANSFNYGQQQNVQDPFVQDQNTYNNQYNNPYGNMPQGTVNNNYYKRKKRSGLAALLCGILGIVMFAVAIAVSLKMGIFSEGVISSIIKESDIMDTIKDEVKKEMKVEFTETVDKELEKTLDKMAEYVEESFTTGEVPEKETLKEDMNEAYNAIYDAIAKDILDEIQKAGEISIDEIKNLEAGKMIADAMGQTEYDKFTEELKVEYGNTVKLTDENRAEVEEIINENRESADVKKKLDEAVDTIYESLEEVSQELKGKEEGDPNVMEILSEATSIVDRAVVIAIAVALVLIVLIFVIDRDASMSLRGLMGPLFAPGLIILIIAIAADKIFAMLVQETQIENTDEFDITKVLETMGDKAISPFMTVAIVMLVSAVIFRIIGTALRKNKEC